MKKHTLKPHTSLARFVSNLPQRLLASFDILQQIGVSYTCEGIAIKLATFNI